MVQNIRDMDELKTFLRSAGNKLVVVEFSATWCGPCKRIYPLFHELARTYHINAIPTFQMFKQTQKGSISRARLISEFHEWALHFSQANPRPAGTNFRTLLKE
uniref:Thioredoxin domain containing 8 n=1 Tax=Sus scrofa TaxID=9823 RepID=A0A5G2R5X9_PIG